MPTWQLFKHHMITRYKDPREVDKARARLSFIRQINTVESYTTAFDRALLEFIEVAGYQPIAADTLFMYREGLKPQVKTFLAARGTINDLKELQAIALEIDASLYNTHGISNNTNTLGHHIISMMIIMVVITITTVVIVIDHSHHHLIVIILIIDFNLAIDSISNVLHHHSIVHNNLIAKHYSINVITWVMHQWTQVIILISRDVNNHLKLTIVIVTSNQ